jgi:hypothetical protein
MIFRLIVLRMKSVSDKSCRENKNARFCPMPPPPQSRAVNEITWKNAVERTRPQMTVWHMRIACRMPKATNTQFRNM